MRIATPPRRAKDVADAALMVTAGTVTAAVEITKVASATEAKAIQATMYPIMLEKKNNSHRIQKKISLKNIFP